MSVKEALLEIGWDKNREFDFGVRCDITELSYVQMTQFRAMVVAAIGTMEQMWRDEQMRKPENRASQSQ